MSSSASNPDYGSLSHLKQGGLQPTAGVGGAAENATDDDEQVRALSLPSTSSLHASIKEKVTLGSFLWHQHSVLGMTVPDDHIPPPITAGPCPCCEVDPAGLTRRRRLFLFFFVFLVSTSLAVQVSLGRHGSFYSLSAMILIVLPLVCHLKENLPTYSKWFVSRGIGPFGHGPDGHDGIRFEELVLLAMFAFSMMKFWKDHHGMGVHVLENVIWVWSGSLIAEIVCLVFKYYFGKYCCCCFNCCVPTTYSLIDDHGQNEDAKKSGEV